MTGRDRRRSTSRTAGLLVWLRTRGLAAQVVGAGLVVAASLALPVDPTTIPLRQNAAADLRCLVACVLALVLIPGLYPGLPEVERSCPRPRRSDRARWFVGVAAAALLVLVTCFAADPWLRGVEVRNATLSAGIVLASAVLLPRVLAWYPLGVLLGATWLFGTVDRTATPRTWAVLFQGPTAASWALSVAAVALGGTLWMWRDGRVTEPQGDG